MPGLRGLTTIAWWLSTCWNCQRQHQAYDSRFERRQHQSSFLEPWPLMIMRLLNNSDDVVDDDDDWKSVIMRMVTTGLAIFFQTNYSSLNPVTPSYKSPSLSTLDKLFWFSSNMKFWRCLKVWLWFNLLIRAHLSGAMRNFKCTSFLLLLGCKGENDQEDEKQLFKSKIILNFTSFSVFGSCQLQDLVKNNNVEKTWDDVYSELETWNLHKNWASSNDWEKLWDKLKKTFRLNITGMPFQYF